MKRDLVDVELRDGTPAVVWPLLPTDRDQLVTMFEQLSPESRRRRFLAPMTHLSDSMLRQLVDEVDGIDHVALVLAVEGPGDEYDPIAIGRMVRYEDLPDAADLAVTVRDDWQRRGVATALLEVLVERRPIGVTHVLTEVVGENTDSLAMLARLGHVRIHDNGSGPFDVEVDLTGHGPHPEVEETESTRLHPVLAQAWRKAFHERDRICPWIAQSRPWWDWTSDRESSSVD